MSLCVREAYYKYLINLLVSLRYAIITMIGANDQLSPVAWLTLASIVFYFFCTGGAHVLLCHSSFAAAAVDRQPC